VVYLHRDGKNFKGRKIGGREVVNYIALALIAIILVYIAFTIYMPSYETGSIYENMENLSDSRINVAIDDKYVKLEHYPVIKNGEIYVPADFVKRYFDPYIFWEREANRLTITTENKVIAMKTEELNYYVNNEPMRLDLPVYRENDMAYIPGGFCETFYNLSFQYSEEYKILTVDKRDKTRTEAKTVKETPMRFEASKKSPKMWDAPEGEKLVIFGTKGDYTLARARNGLVGYALSKHIGEGEKTVPIYKPEEPEPKVPPLEISGKIALLWDQVTTAEAASNPERREAVPGVNVMSPTWFEYDYEKIGSDSEADIVNIGDAAYVQAAHANGRQVWAMLRDFTDNYWGSEISRAILTNPENREKTIKQLLAFSSMYSLDGINLDFENVTESDAEYYLQFLRELRPFLNRQGVILSIDMYVPVFTKYMDRENIAKTVDYICVMAYDEHSSHSENSGPVASLGFVENGIAETLSEGVPKEKILLGVPFYVRIWTEWQEKGQVHFKKEDRGMKSAYDYFIKNGAEFTWMPDIGCFYAEFVTEEDGREVVKKVWLEDERSVNEKLNLADRYGVAGVAFWKRALETEAVWGDVMAYISS
jgi:spore germination protein YaaH